ncbi:MAG: DUF4492 domain-containing protein [Bacteroidales bacterium]
MSLKNKPSFFIRVFHFYRDGFREMTLGRTLWVIILVKLFIVFAILRVFFFPDFLNSKAKNKMEKSEYVGNELVNRKAVE